MNINHTNINTVVSQLWLTLTYCCCGLFPLDSDLNFFPPWIHEYTTSEYWILGLNFLFGALLNAASIVRESLLYNWTKFSRWYLIISFSNSSNEVNVAPVKIPFLSGSKLAAIFAGYYAGTWPGAVPRWSMSVRRYWHGTALYYTSTRLDMAPHVINRTNSRILKTSGTGRIATAIKYTKCAISNMLQANQRG